MGAQFQVASLICREEDLDAEFAKLVERARYDYGHAGYTGTFAEKDEWRFSPKGKAQNFATAADALAWAEDCLCEVIDDKWGPAAVIPTQETTGDGCRIWVVAGWCSE